MGKTLRIDLQQKMRDVDAKKRGTEILLEEMGAQRSEAEAQQVMTSVHDVVDRHKR